MTIHHLDCASAGLSEIAELIRQALNYTDSLPIGPNDHDLNFAFLRGSQIELLARVEDRPDVIFEKNGPVYCSTETVRMDRVMPFKDPLPEGWPLTLFVRFSDRVLRRVPLLWSGICLAPKGVQIRGYAWKDFDAMSHT